MHKNNIITPEESVIESIKKIEPLGIPFCAVYVSMSKLQPENRGYRQLEIVSKLFEPLLNHAQARLFLLSNNDFLLLTANPILDVIEDILFQIRGLFADDYFISSKEYEKFQHVFFLDRDKDELLKFLKPSTPTVVSKSKKILLPKKQQATELSPSDLEKLLAQIEQNDTLKFIRRQSIVSFAQKGTVQEFAQEFFTSSVEVQNAYLPQTNLLTDKSLFAMLKDTLDRRMMANLIDVKLNRWPDVLSLNLNVQSIFTPIFDKLSKQLSAQLMVEFQIADILQDVALYYKACDKLKDMGALVALDGIGVNELEFIKLEPFAPDFYKFFYSIKWKDEKHFKSLKNFYEKNARRVILSRCGDEEALLLGRKIGIRLFQGHFLDMLLAALSKNTCLFGQECTLNDCKLRHAVVSSVLRKQCVHEPHLDAFVPFKGDEAC